MKRLIVFLFLILCGVAHSAQIVNVEYIHNAIAQKWDITVPYNAELTNPRVAANMKYLLTVVDVANEMLNGEPTTDYGNGEYATLVAADTVATDTAVETLVKIMDNYEYKFFAEVNVRTYDYPSVDIYAYGDFYIDWGDGTREMFSGDVGRVLHKYATAGVYNLKIGGLATDVYSTDGTYWFSLSDFSDVMEISGCLGCVFPTLSDGTNPKFSGLFNNSSITQIPDNLFAGLKGTPAPGMFSQTFMGTNISNIPDNIFAELSGDLVESEFSYTFANTNITNVPENLFENFSSAGSYSFNGTFASTPLAVIPETLFKNVTMAGHGAFDSTFAGVQITSIPENLISHIQITAPYCFAGMFADSSVANIPGNLFKGLYVSGDGCWGMFADMFSGAQITSIPDNLFSQIIIDSPENCSEMFSYTFEGTPITSIPENLFENVMTPFLSAQIPDYMFGMTFAECVDLTGCLRV